MRKLTALFGSCLFFFIVMTMYLLLDQFQVNVDKQKFLEEVCMLIVEVKAMIKSKSQASCKYKSNCDPGQASFKV